MAETYSRDLLSTVGMRVRQQVDMGHAWVPLGGHAESLDQATSARCVAGVVVPQFNAAVVQRQEQLQQTVQHGRLQPPMLAATGPCESNLSTSWGGDAEAEEAGGDDHDHTRKRQCP
ncbi:Dif1p KNAG_0B06400 [Huiozyma naganishii CBS 8797]|uniref:Uncharacterized protein n=1 Tax=Huiozyma naganishii (strain ATCC MYA-139 / BCRC 22969 / CBS 8797 / KCTC 17520 / NBRC 10181 / NCYC 3082 / Yp74L-3) TaxID=1071383 RepID=J7RHP8_HUIN7|nr:hypothetical protein KNAG_0B06400 [Kazachstania naganishii CBS 8797]CCK69068.1 hypothetical protein KNAG_0B06400 [Kazachstania naganishii CBS 8797]